MNGRGQISIEIVIIAVILLGLLLATSFIMIQRNNDTNRIATIQRDMQKCDRIASTITSFSSNKGYSKATITVAEKSVRIEKGSVKVGDIYCSYKGDVYFQVPDPGTDISAQTDGFDLHVEPNEAKQYTVEKIGEKVVFDNE